MPEVHFRVLWPDGSVDQCYSPSSVIYDHLSGDQSYSVEDFMARTRQALTLASKRVEQIYGYPCSRANAQLSAFEHRQGRFTPTDLVTCLDLPNLKSSAK